MPDFVGDRAPCGKLAATNPPEDAGDYARHLSAAGFSGDRRHAGEAARPRRGPHIDRRILRYGFGVAYHEIDHEVRLPEVHGRADTLFGSVIFEFKRDLRQELSDVWPAPDYVAERERQTGRRILGIATDGANLSPTNCGAATCRDRQARGESGAAEALLAWLEPALSNRDDLTPDPLTVERELGRNSLASAVPAVSWSGYGLSWGQLRGCAEAPAVGRAAA